MLLKTDVVLFDFDGTLSARDSNVEFAKYCFRHSFRPWLFLPLMAVCGIVRWFKPDGIWWRENIRRFMTPQMVKKFAPAFIKQHKRERFGWAKERVQSERDAGRKVIMVSASADYLLPYLVRDMKFDAVFCSVMDKKKPWRYEFLCWGRNKVYKMDEWAKANKMIPHVVRAYSDSKSDLPMMEIADEQVWIDKRTGMRKQA
ncbi:MAG: haloacid dehalogenase-like hydrolase [Alphaproteobacteria bacterium]|nr:haloacid dehalogenase-like hydrolase [Alphaproteobacteria bacterium]